MLPAGSEIIQLVVQGGTGLVHLIVQVDEGLRVCPCSTGRLGPSPTSDPSNVLFVCLFVLATPGVPVVALLPQGRLSQGAAQSMPGLRLKKLGAALPLAHSSNGTAVPSRPRGTHNPRCARWRG